MRAWGEDLLELADRGADAGRPPPASSPPSCWRRSSSRSLRFKFPRLASMLSLAGAIVDDPGLGSRFDWEKLRDFMLVTPELVDETFWDELFGDGRHGRHRPDAGAARRAADRRARRRSAR